MKCAHCNRPARTGRTQCRQCAVRQAKRLKRDRKLRLAAGLCLACGKKRPERGRTRCAKCLKQNNAAVEARRERLGAEGLCKLCGRGRAIALDGMRCRRCRRSANESSRRADARRRAAGICLTCPAPARRGRVRCPRCTRRYQLAARARHERQKPSLISPLPTGVAVVTGVKSAPRRDHDRWRAKALRKSVKADLTDQEREVVRWRWAPGGKLLAEIGRQFGVTRERIRQIEASAAAKIVAKRRTR